MTDAEVKQAIERHRLMVTYLRVSKEWLVMHADNPHAVARAETLTEAVAEVVRQVEEQTK